MKFSMNGFRRNLSADCQNLKEVVEQIINGDHYDEDDLVNAVNDIITHSNVLNCVFNKDDPDFTDMSDLEVDHIDI